MEDEKEMVTKVFFLIIVILVFATIMACLFEAQAVENTASVPDNPYNKCILECKNKFE